MAIAAASYDTSAAARPLVTRERDASPVGSYGRDDAREGGIAEQSGEMSFWDLLDVINPLQHIPIVSTLYRNLTGDTIQPAARVMGGVLFGGVIGGAAAIANAVVEQSDGQDIGEQAMTALGFGDGAHPAAPTAVAASAGGLATAAAPSAPPPTPQAGSAPMAALPPALGANQPNVGAPIRLAPAAAAATAANQTAALTTTPPTALPLSGGAAVPPSKMPARDTPLASSTMVKHAAPKFAAPLPGSIPVSAQAASSAGAAPEALSETMMRNLAKYEQSRKAAQPAAPTMRVSG